MEFFHEITQIPRPSKFEQKMIEHIKEFGKKNNLEKLLIMLKRNYQEACYKGNGKQKRGDLTDSPRYGAPEKQR